MLIATGLQPALAADDDPFRSLGELNNDLGLGGGGGGGQDEILEPDQAFKLTTFSENGQVVARWEIAEGHYMYRDKTSIAPVDAAVSTGQLQLPGGELKHDEFFGDIYVFHHEAEARLPVTSVKDGAKSTVFKVKYQGCSEISGICYPPITKEISLDISPMSSAAAATLDSARPAATQPTAGAGEPMSEQDRFLGRLMNASLFSVLGFSLIAGVLIAFTACMYPMIPILSSIIVGQGEQITPARAFTLSLVYVEGMALTFGVIGAFMASVGSSIGIQAYFQSPWLLIPITVLFILLSLSMFGFYNIQIPSALQSKINTVSNQQKGGTLLGVAIMGILSALIIGPCGGPVLVAELTYAASTANPVNGFLALFAFGNGMGIPLLIVGASGGKLLPKAGTWMDAVKGTAGVILLAVALVILERMPNIFSPALIMVLWSALFIISGVYLGALEPLQQEATGWKRFWKGFGIVLIIYGVLVLIGGITGGKNVFDPMHGSTLTSRVTSGSTESDAGHEVSFMRIKTVEDLEQSIAKASQSGQTVMLDFYADWCGYCQTLEQYVFPDSRVQSALSNTILLQANVTDMDDEDTRLMKHLGVSLPPTILLYDTTGKELTEYRIVGEVDADQLSAHLNKAFK
jgi:thiol:disulfide interchange protein DsbD